MRESFKTAMQVTGEPLPLEVRQEIHELIRLGFTVFSVEQTSASWRIRYSGARHTFCLVPRHEDACKDTAA
jgi:hypothetical protein